MGFGAACVGRTLYHQDGRVEGVSDGADRRSHHD